MGEEKKKHSITVREAAVSVLMRILEGPAKKRITLNEALADYRELPHRERAFLIRLTNDTLAHLLTIDSVIDRFSRLKTVKLKPYIRTILRLSVCQILYIDTVPDYTAVNEAVILTGHFGLEGLKPFVNGVLRSIVRDGGRIILPDREKDPAHFLSVNYSVPEWIIKRWLKRYRMDAVETILKAMEQERPLSIRVNLSKTKIDDLKERLIRAGVHIAEHPYLPYALTVENFEDLTALPGFAEGAFVIQDPGSMLVGEVAKVTFGMKCLDLCAAPGGKSMHFADCGAEVIACDRTKEKIAKIEENKARCGFSHIQTVCRDSRRKKSEWEEAFDLVAADVPCSGLGVMGRKYDIRYHVTPGQITNLTEIQREIIATGLDYVKPGGLFLYSTCTINGEENEDQAALIRKDGRFEAVDLTKRLPKMLSKEASGFPGGAAQLKNGCLQVLPGYTDCDGFFLSLFRRKEA